jgi:hypothetical protein
MPSTTESITSSFPVATLTPLAIGTNEPTYQSIRIARTQLNSNAASIYASEGGGLHGHLTLTMTAAEYLVAAGADNAFTAPLPPIPLIHPAGATGPQISEAVRLHKELLDKFQLYHNVDKALRNQLITATPAVFLQARKDPILGFGQRTCLDLLSHLRSTYGEITPEELDQNTIRMSAAWHPPTAIEDLFEQLRAGAEFATDGGDEPSAPQMVRLGYNIIFKTGLFNTACREWRDAPADAKTFAHLKTHFKKWDKDRKLIETTSSAGYHGAHHVPQQPTPAAAAAPTHASSEMAQMREQIQALTSALSSSRPMQNAAFNAGSASSTSSTITNSTPLAPVGLSYCWTHGSSRNRSHTSPTCHNKAEGHIDTATNENKCGGSEKTYTQADRRVPR